MILKVSQGKPFPLGSSYDGKGTNFSIFSANATKVVLCLFDESGTAEISQIEINENTEPTFEDRMYFELTCNGRFGSRNACNLVYKSNAEIFKNWDSKLLGDKNSLLNNTKKEVIKDEIVTENEEDKGKE